MSNCPIGGFCNFLPELIWFVIGIFLLVLEFILPGVIICFFGAGAILTAILTWIGLLPNLASQLIFFLVSSLLLLIFLRRYFSKWLKGKSIGGEEDIENEFVGKKVKVTKKIEPNNDFGRIEYEGTDWKASADEVIEAGEVVEIIEKQNITFKVKSLQ